MTAQKIKMKQVVKEILNSEEKNARGNNSVIKDPPPSSLLPISIPITSHTSEPLSNMADYTQVAPIQRTVRATPRVATRKCSNGTSCGTEHIHIIIYCYAHLILPTLDTNRSSSHARMMFWFCSPVYRRLNFGRRPFSRFWSNQEWKEEGEKALSR